MVGDELEKVRLFILKSLNNEANLHVTGSLSIYYRFFEWCDYGKILGRLIW